MDKARLPNVVTKYLEWCGVAALSTKARNTRIEQVGEIRLAPTKPWMPFKAVQDISIDRTRFVWRARFRMAPLVTGIIEDAYENGCGRLDAKLWGVLSVAHGRGPEIDRGEAQRYLAELAWCPEAFLLNPELNFSALSESSVRVWVHDEDTYVDLAIGKSGEIVGAATATRARGKTIQPWNGRFRDFVEFDGVRVPIRAEAWWETPDGRFTYWRGEVTSFHRIE